ncbi:hypothetical protein NPIL_24711 [Nephila pilipes]|uniref:Uncharacterized protein n=1 Tax=Nephila pilipes TaxID=299642 RepID=A0A8X6P1B1_NEPPI|nr:hypothetical protein NPIL_24711 [Nephila pilipes]
MAVASQRGSNLTLQGEIIDTQHVTELFMRLSGDIGVGKNTLVKRLRNINGPLYDESTPILKLNLDSLELNLAYISGSRRNGQYFITIDFEPAPFPQDFVETPFYLLKALLFCIDVNNPESVENIGGRVGLYRDNFFESMPSSVLVGTKIDLRNNNAGSISTAHGRELARAVEINRYIECSAWRKNGTMLLFQTVLSLLDLWENN